MYIFNHKIVETLLSTNVTIESQAHNTMHQATDKKDSSCPKMALCITHSTPLHCATARGHLTVCWLLLLLSFSIDDADNLGNTPLHQATSRGSDNVAQCFLEHDADMNKQIDSS